MVRQLKLKEIAAPALLAVSALAGAASWAVGYGVRADEPLHQVSVIALTDDQRKCLESHPASVCIPKLPAPAASPTPSAPADFADDAYGLDDHLNSLRADLFKDTIQVNPSVLSDPLFGEIGVHLGGERLYDDEILSDPDRRATEQSARKPGVWVRHHIEIRPELNKGHFRLDPTPDFHAKGEVSLGIAYSMIVHVTKRHEIDAVYDDNFWNYTRSNMRLMGQSLPLYWKLPTKIADNDFLPGEGFELERVGTFSFFVGGSANLVGPPSFGPISVGLQARAGIQLSHTAGHFRTAFEMRQGGKARLVLQKSSDWSLGPYASVGLNATVGPISGLAMNFADAGYQKNWSHVTVLDLLIDLSNPQAEEALHKAYLGDFTLAQQISADGQTMRLAGIENSTSIQIASHGTHKWWNFLFWGRSSLKARADEITHSMDAENNVVDRHFEDDMMDKTSKGWSENFHLIVTARTDLGAQATESRSLNYQFTDNDNKLDGDEMLALVRFASVIAPDSSADAVAGIRASIRDKNGGARVRIALDLDAHAFTAMLELGSAFGPAFWRAWASVMELSDPASWASYSEDQRNHAAKALGERIEKHYKKARKFCKQANDALGKSTPDDRTHALLSAIHGLGDELYPVSALLTVADPRAALTSFRLTLKGVSGVAEPRTLGFGSVGDHYQAPARVLGATPQPHLN